MKPAARYFVGLKVKGRIAPADVAAALADTAGDMSILDFMNEDVHCNATMCEPEIAIAGPGPSRQYKAWMASYDPGQVRAGAGCAKQADIDIAVMCQRLAVTPEAQQRPGDEEDRQIEILEAVGYFVQRGQCNLGSEALRWLGLRARFSAKKCILLPFEGVAEISKVVRGFGTPVGCPRSIAKPVGMLLGEDGKLFKPVRISKCRGGCIEDASWRVRTTKAKQRFSTLLQCSKALSLVGGDIGD